MTGVIKKRTILFYEGDTIKKYIYEQKFSNSPNANYEESDLDAKTDSRQLLLPKTSRGRAKPINPSLLQTPTYKLAHLMVSLRDDGKGSVISFNSSNDQLLPLPPSEISSKADFAEYTEKYIASCPEGYEKTLEAFRTKKRNTVKFSAGDIFRVQITPTLYTYALILGKVRDILKWEEMPKEHPLQKIMCQPIAYRQYAVLTERANMTADELVQYPLLPTKYGQDNEILWETFPIVCHKELEKSDIDFSFFIDPVDKKIAWGLAVHDIEEGNLSVIDRFQQWRAETDSPAAVYPYGCGVSLHIVYDELKAGEIPLDEYQKLDEPKQMITELYGLDKESPDDDFACKFGGITAEQYLEKVKNNHLYNLRIP